MTPIRPWDFLKRAAKTPLRRCYLAAGAVFEVSTNSQPILAAAEACFAPVAEPATVDCRLRLWVDPGADSRPPWPKPYFRGLDHLVFAGFDPQNSLLVELRRPRVIGRFSPAMAADTAYWKAVIWPVLMTMVGASLGITELHCACVARGRDGLLLAGDSGSGKSTLSLALTQSGFAFLSDDRTYLSRRDGQLLAWGPPTPLKLRPEAAVHFPEFAGREAGVTLDGEPAFQIDVERQLCPPHARHCRPRWLVFLERQERPEFSLTEMSRVDAAARLRRDLLPESPEAMKRQWAAVDELVERPGYLLRHGGDPRTVARALAEWCETAPEAAGLTARPE